MTAATQLATWVGRPVEVVSAPYRSLFEEAVYVRNLDWPHVDIFGVYVRNLRPVGSVARELLALATGWRCS